MQSKEKAKRRYAGIYQELAEIVGDNMVRKIYERFHGMEVSMPSRLYTIEYVIERAMKENPSEWQAIARKYGYNEKYLKRLILEKIENQCQDTKKGKNEMK